MCYCQVFQDICFSRDRLSMVISAGCKSPVWPAVTFQDSNCHLQLCSTQQSCDMPNYELEIMLYTSVQNSPKAYIPQRVKVNLERFMQSCIITHQMSSCISITLEACCTEIPTQQDWAEGLTLNISEK